MASTTNTVQFVVEVVDKATGPIKEVAKQVTSFGDDVKTTAWKVKDFGERNKETFQKMAVIGAAAFGAISLAVKWFVNEANEQIRVNTQLEAVLKSTGNAVGLTAKEIEDMAGAMQYQTGIADDVIQTGQNMLLTFTNIWKETFPQATQTMLDMATAMNWGITPGAEQLKNTAIQLGKALNDPIMWVNALRRVWVALTDQQQDEIKTLVWQNKLYEAQQVILKELGKEFGWSALAQAQTFEWQMAILNAQLADTSEAIGMALIPVLQQAMSYITPVIKAITDWIASNPELASKIILVAGAIAWLVAVVGTLWLLLPTIVTGLGAIAAAVWFLLSPVWLVVAAIAWLIYIFTTDFAGIRTTVVAMVSEVSAWFMQLWDVIKKVWEGISLVWRLTWDGITAYFEFMITIMAGILGACIELFRGNWQGFLDILWSTFRFAWEGIKSFFSTILQAIGLLAQAARANILKGVRAFIDMMVTFFKTDAKAMITDWFSSMLDGIVAITKSIFNYELQQVETFVNYAIKLLNKLINVANSIPGVKISLIDPVSIGRLAKGWVAGKWLFGWSPMAAAVWYATGWVVGGARGVDNVPAMLSAGEVVLNAAQQRNVASKVGSGDGQQVNIYISGNEFFGSWAEFAEKIGDTIMTQMKTQLSFQSY